MSNIDNTEDLLDSRDIIERIEELEGEQDSYVEEYEEAKEEAEELAEERGEWEPTERLTDATNALSRYWDITPEEVDDAVAGFRNPADEFNGDEELHSLKKLAEQLEGYGDWEHGETLIRKSYFVEYVEDLLKDCGDLPKDIPWYISIDWEATARNLKIDYTEASFDGVTYYMRA